MFWSSRSTNFLFSFSTAANYFCNRLALASISDSSCHISLRRRSTRRISIGDTTKSHFLPDVTQSAQRSESVPTRHYLPCFVQRVQGRMVGSRSSRPSSRRRTAEFDDRLVRCGGMKDRWFLGTRNLGGGASVRTKWF